MAVTAEDKKYLSAQGLSAVQKATDDWNKANSIGDKAGMAAAAAAAAAARNSAGYTSNSSGQYVSHIYQYLMSIKSDTLKTHLDA